MKSETNHHEKEEDSQLGGTDQVEQLAADLAEQDNHEKVTDEDRKEALQQMVDISPPNKPKPNLE